MYKEESDVFSLPVKAGKRTYFFDVKSTRGSKDYFMTITESRRQNNPDGTYSYEKHKIFLYKEDFQKFQEGLAQAVDYITENCFGGEIPQRHFDPKENEPEY